MIKSTLQCNLENFVCMLTQDYESFDQGLPLSTIKSLLVLIDEPFFASTTCSHWEDIHNTLQQYYIQNHFELNADEHINFKLIEEGNAKSLVETLIILCSFVNLFNSEVYEDIKDYYIKNIKIKPNDDFFGFIDEYSNDLREIVQSTNNITQNIMTRNEDTQKLLDIISFKTTEINELHSKNNIQKDQIKEHKDTIEELKTFLEEKKNNEKEVKRNLVKQEKIFEIKFTNLEDELLKQKNEYDARIKKMITNHDLELSMIKQKFQNFEEEKISLKKEITKVENEKKIIEKSVKIKNFEIQKLKKENENIKDQVDAFEIKCKINENKKNKYSDLVKKNKELTKVIEELENIINNMNKTYKKSTTIDYNYNTKESNQGLLDMHNEMSPSQINIYDDINDMTHNEYYKISHIGLRESELEIEDERNSKNKFIYNNSHIINQMNMSINSPSDQTINYTQINKHINQADNKNLVETNHLKKNVWIDKDDAEILYSVMSEYITNHLEMKNYYISRKTRERNIMRPFMIDDFLK